MCVRASELELEAAGTDRSNRKSQHGAREPVTGFVFYRLVIFSSDF
jgi:hypothetical protein